MKAAFVVGSLVLTGCVSSIDRAASLIDDAEYIEARAVLVRETCADRNDTPQCALAHALVADGLGDRQARDAWVARAESRSRTGRLSDVEQSRLETLTRRVAWERQVAQLAAREAGHD